MNDNDRDAVLALVFVLIVVALFVLVARIPPDSPRMAAPQERASTTRDTQSTASAPGASR